MSFLLDTNALSEYTKVRPNAGYVEWSGLQSADALSTSVIVMGELRFGVVDMEPGPKRLMLEGWMIEVAAGFGPRILAIDLPVVNAWADVALRHRRALRTVSAADELIAATAIAHDLTLITRNTRDFQFSGCKLHSPWS